ncbi:hypothetical protein MIND_01226100 [Mycena indigotica]|uniref:Phytanoyl-CoA dioxygenase n=1 Tax=Mycena indigotica TaxID=2126181 RepID=A0A8H6VSB5_9AGAR|nr:uncharacterized protein MIND_01226100 [Mycena indigotica]KAF7292004.1 hypothetical protein MIND_01226100 [Mycena indigotica]
MTAPQPVLTPEDRAHFLEHGFVHLHDCFSRESAEKFSEHLWPRLGMLENDKSTWHSERIHMPGHNSVSVKDFAPKAWGAMCELLGGEERISDERKLWHDSFIVNLGVEGQSGLPYRELDNWHVDGDFFIHFLDSPEQALLVIPIWRDIDVGGGGTAICTEGIGKVAQELFRHPNGVTPWMDVRGTPEPDKNSPERLAFYRNVAKLAQDSSFHEMTGKVGDVYLLHPLMVHSATRNSTRVPRVITNPPVSLNAPFRLRKGTGEFNLVEQKTLKELGHPEGLDGWEIIGGREEFVPKRVKIQQELKAKEEERLKLVHVLG